MINRMFNVFVEFKSPLCTIHWNPREIKELKMFSIVYSVVFQENSYLYCFVFRLVGVRVDVCKT
jgi:hypothetical protein